MPRNVRNFWVEAEIDGRATTLSGGPQSKDGGIDIVIYQRSKGDVTRVLRITGRQWSGKLILDVEHPTQAVQPLEGGFRIVTER